MWRAFMRVLREKFGLRTDAAQIRKTFRIAMKQDHILVSVRKLLVSGSDPKG